MVTDADAEEKENWEVGMTSWLAMELHTAVYLRSDGQFGERQLSWILVLFPAAWYWGLGLVSLCLYFLISHNSDANDDSNKATTSNLLVLCSAPDTWGLFFFKLYFSFFFKKLFVLCWPIAD